MRRESREAARYADPSLFLSHREGEARGPEGAAACGQRMRSVLLQPVLPACSRRSFCGYLLCLLLKVKVGIEFNSQWPHFKRLFTHKILLLLFELLLFVLVVVVVY